MSELNRKLAAIMFTDMVGFTSLMQENEELGLIKRARHKEVLENYHKKYKGELIQYFGDGTLSIFSNSIDAILCAIDIQKDLKSPIDVPLRIGIHSGNIILQEDGIIGDAVNIASRIESFSNPGSVLISDVVRDQTKNQVDWSFVPLGKFKLKNVERPFEIFAVASDGLIVPPPDLLMGKGERAAVPYNVPEPAGPILGREKELIEISNLLQSNKLVTITGTGGMGKTRISIECGKRLKSEFYGGVAFISLATLPNDEAILPIVAEIIGVKEATGRDLIKGIASIISDKKVLLILDNLEHIKTAGREVSELLSHCQNLRILCTSRSTLNINAEQEYALHTLAVPNDSDLNSMLNYASIELFLNRARKVNMDFQLTNENAKDIVAICKRMDGLPLALELAAARIRILTPGKLLKRLGRALDLLTSGSNDVPERHQTLRQTIDWSYSLLNENEKLLFARLAIFSGGFTLEAIEEVCYVSEDESIFALDELESLNRNGLVEKLDGGKRFSFLQTVKDFALEKFNSSAEKEGFLKRHAEYFRNFAQFIHRVTQGENQEEGLDMAYKEDSNMQAALDYLLGMAKNGDEYSREMGLEICGDLWMYWHFKGWNILTRDYIEAFFESIDDNTASLGKSKALMGYAVAYWMLGNYEKALEIANRHKEIALNIDDELEVAKSELSLLVGYTFIDPEKAMKCSVEAIQRFSKISGEDYWIGLATWFQGNLHLMKGELDISKQRYIRSLELTKIHNDNEHKGSSYGGLALIEFILGNFAESIELYEKSLAAYKKVQDVAELARIYSEMSWAYLAAKNTESAREYTMESIDLYQKVGSPRGVGLSMIGLAAIESVEGNHKTALEIASAAEKFAEQEGIVNVYGDNKQGLKYLEEAQNHLSENEIEDARNSGSKLTLNEVLILINYQKVLIN